MGLAVNLIEVSRMTKLQLKLQLSCKLYVKELSRDSGYFENTPFKNADRASVNMQCTVIFTSSTDDCKGSPLERRKNGSLLYGAIAHIVERKRFAVFVVPSVSMLL